MDSDILNAFQDDPFDKNCIKYDDNELEFWANGDETMDMQLTETLRGILPIPPTEVASDLYDSSILKDDFSLECSKDGIVTGLQIKHEALFENLSSENFDADIKSYEFTTVTRNDMESADDDDNNYYITDIDEIELQNYNNQTPYSCETFRSRTDSSSIGDYESHPSDYEDDDDDYLVDDRNEVDGDDGNNADADSANNITPGCYIFVPELRTNEPKMGDNFDNLPELCTSEPKMRDNSDNSQLLKAINCTQNKTCTLSTNTIASDVDGLGLHIDASSFDLAEFITQDDFLPQQTEKTVTSVGITEYRSDLEAADIGAVQVISKHTNSDSDSDIIVDVETVEFGTEAHLWVGQLQQNTTEFNGNSNDGGEQCEEESAADTVSNSAVTNSELELDANEIKAITSEPVLSVLAQQQKQLKQQQNFARNFSVVPSKRQCDFLKGRFGSSRSKNISMQRNLKGAGKKCADVKTLSQKLTKEEVAKQYSTSEKSTENTVDAVANDKSSILSNKGESNTILEQHSKDESVPSKDNAVLAMPTPQQKSTKRILNLEEYKRRRGCIDTAGTNFNKVDQETLLKLHNQPAHKYINASAPMKHSSDVASIVQSLKSEATKTKLVAVDPIVEARNKVRRIQEQKKAQLLKIIDTTVSAKVPRITKMHPLKEADTKTKNCKESMESSAIQIASSATKIVYEEIIIVSASCNTDISIPPQKILPSGLAHTENSLKQTNIASRSLLRSSALLFNISNTFQKVQASDNVKLSKHSLITSIHKEVTKQTSANVTKTNSNRKSVLNKTTEEEHGENKIIMHLPKDRSRNLTCSTSTQTHTLLEFPPLLILSTDVAKRRSRERKRSHRTPGLNRFPKSSGRSQRGREYDSDLSSIGEKHSRRSRSRSAAGSYSSSSDHIQRSDAIGSGGYSSRSSRHHRSSISSSYSESERNTPHNCGRSYVKHRSSRKFSRSSSSSSSEYSDYRRSQNIYRYRRSRSRSFSKRRISDRNVSQPAVEERRIVYVGRIEKETNKEILRRKFLVYGPIKQITIHYKDTGMKYGFVTYERSQDAFDAIDNSARDPHINMYDISFGGRRAFCRASYADLDNAGINTYHSYVFPQVANVPKEEDSFEALLRKVKAKISANRSSQNANTNVTKT